MTGSTKPLFEDWDPGPFTCSACGGQRAGTELYGGPADQDPDAPVCYHCIEESFAEHG